MYSLARRTPNRANWIALRRFFRRAVIASSDALLNNLDLPIETGCTTFDQRNVCGKAHFIHMPPGIEIIKSVEDHCKASKPIDIELCIFYVAVMCLELNIGIELMCCILGHL